MFQLPHGVRGLLERVGPVKRRVQLARFDELGQPLEVLSAFAGQQRDEPLPDERRQEGPPDLAGHPEDGAGVLAADEDGGAARGERTSELADGGVTGDVEDEVPAASAVGPVVVRVGENVVGADGADVVGLEGTADAGDVGSKCVGDLDRVAADAPGRTCDEDRLSGLEPAQRR